MTSFIRRRDCKTSHRLLLLSLTLWACTADEARDDSVMPRRQGVDAADGDLTVSGTVQPNRYARLTADATAGATQLRVDSGALSAMGLKKGDLLLVMQMQGAQINTSALGVLGEAHGTVTQLAGAGRYELISVEGSNAAAGQVFVSAQCGGLRNGYSATGNSQIVRVPQYGELIIPSGATLSAQPWNGSTGGIIAVRARHLRVDSGGILHADGAGFRGGQAARPSSNRSAGLDVASFASVSVDDGAEKGEGIAGTLVTLGRGAAGNGGGGGNSFGAGGGGGANAGTAGTWTGHGVMRLVGGSDALAWAQDPIGSGGLSTASGGGRGGYSQAQSNQDATLVGPGDAAWGGNSRSERGGRGGYPVDNNAATQLFLGGGGGAGDRISSGAISGSEGSGGPGGGVVYVLSDRIDGSGTIAARGGPGSATQTGGIGGAGGGGAGGSIVLNALSVAGGLQVLADGGDGGSQQRSGTNAFNDALGPGGGGGGGFIALPGSRSPTTVLRAAGGPAGTSAADVVTEFPQNGATAGHDGTTAAALNPAGAATPICAPVDLRIAVTDGTDHAAPGSEVSYLITVYNDGPFTASAAPVSGFLSPRADFVDWTCAADPGPQGDASLVACSQALGINNVNTKVTLTPGATARIVVRAILPSDLMGTLTYSASVAAASTQQDPDLSNNTASDSTSVGPEADLVIEAVVAPSPTKSGQSLTYLLSVRNEGINDARDVQLRFIVPEGSTLSPIAPAQGDGWTCQTASQAPQVVCTLPLLGYGAAPVVAVSIVPPFNAAYAVGVAQVESAALDPNPSNNSASAVADITYDVTRYRRSVFAGGGLACSYGAGPRPGSIWFSALSLLSLAVLGLFLRRRHTSRATAQSMPHGLSSDASSAPQPHLSTSRLLPAPTPTPTSMMSAALRLRHLLP